MSESDAIRAYLLSLGAGIAEGNGVVGLALGDPDGDALGDFDGSPP